MGRYDKIKVYSGGSWKVPSRIRVYNNGWKDLGESTGFNTNTMYVRHNNQNKRITLNRRDITTTSGIASCYGTIYLYPTNGFCYCPRTSSGTYTNNWGFYMVAYKETSGEKNLITIHSKSNPDNTYLRIMWREDGRIEVRNRYNGGTYYGLLSNRYYGTGTWVRINAYASKGSYNFRLETMVEGSSSWDVVSGTIGGSFVISNAENYVGEPSGLIYKDGFTCYGSRYGYSGGSSVEFNMLNQSYSGGTVLATDAHSSFGRNTPSTVTTTVWE